MILSHLLQAKSGILQKQNLIIAKKVSNREPLDIGLLRYVRYKIHSKNKLVQMGKPVIMYDNVPNTQPALASPNHMRSIL